MGVETTLHSKPGLRLVMLYAHSICDTTAPLQLQLPLVAHYKCYAFVFYLLQCVYYRFSKSEDIVTILALVRLVRVLARLRLRSSIPIHGV